MVIFPEFSDEFTASTFRMDHKCLSETPWRCSQ